MFTMNQIRQEKIKRYIQHKGPVSIKEIRELFPEVSAMTIHRDMEKLEQEGAIIRTRGGAMPTSKAVGTEAKLETRMLSHVREKASIAKKAVRLLEEGSAVFFDAGTSVLSLVQIMPDMDLNVFTIGVNIAAELSRLNKPIIHMCGGTLNRSNQAVSGATTLAMLEEINIGMAFLGVSGYTVEGGFTCGKEEEMMVKSLVMKKAAKTVILMDDSKYGKLMPYTFGSLEEADYIISNHGLPEDFVRLAEKSGVTLL